jgi:hypothetical protein
MDCWPLSFLSVRSELSVQENRFSALHVSLKKEHEKKIRDEVVESETGKQQTGEPKKHNNCQL